MSKEISLDFSFQPVIGVGFIKIDNPAETYWTIVVPFLQIGVSVFEDVDIGPPISLEERPKRTK